MHNPLTDIHDHFEINRPVRYRNTAKRNYFHGRTDRRRSRTTTIGSFFRKKKKLLVRLAYILLLMLSYLLCRVRYLTTRGYKNCNYFSAQHKELIGCAIDSKLLKAATVKKKIKIVITTTFKTLSMLIL